MDFRIPIRPRERRERKNVGDCCFVCKQPIVITHNYGLIILTINYGSPDHRHHHYYYYIIDVSVDKKMKNKVYVVEDRRLSISDIRRFFRWILLLISTDFSLNSFI